MRISLALIPALTLAATLFAADTTTTKSTAPKAAAKPVAVAVTKGTPAKPVTPRKAGEFVVHMPDGTQKLLSSYRGKLVVMAFMHTTCPHCQKTAGILNKIQAEYEAKGVQVLGVTFDQYAQRDVAAFNRTFATGFTCGWAPEDQVLKFVQSPPGYYVPMMAFIDKTGTIRSQYLPTGDNDGVAEKFLDNQEVNIRKEIDKYLKATAAPAAPKAETK